ncbi:HNH endonuclease signature motif containing protein [Nocardioides sp. GY 10127]|uniref:HNH endonuclease signature motif containing protein n=1 Tax=Nocardioides sp. GY 10127 TaxID=2569762 RepID=UPI0010A8E869|nr:HNH endonuclease signature motif containing protein [Nocardioides sp. GY 10127]TIC86588.1 DUF222 domain-containing protein [Nocardioides sp. GY 10127]
MALTTLELPESSPTPTSASVARLLDALQGELDGLDPTALPDAEPQALVDLVEGIQHLRSRLAALEARALAAVEERGLARTELGWGSTADWYTHLAGLRRGAGRRIVDAAVRLVRERPATLESMESGATSPEQAHVVLEHLDRLPGDAQLREVAELTLLDETHRLNATDLDRTAVRILARLDPDGTAAREEAAKDRLDRVAHQRRFLSITDDGCGGVRLRGRGTLEDAAVLRAALLPLTSPVVASGDEVARLDPRDHGTRLWDAVVQVAQHALDTELPPETHGARPRLSVTVPLDVLQGAAPDDVPASEDGTPLPVSTLRRLACDAEIVPAVLGSRGEVLDVGRSTRVVPVSLWRALVVRDAGCAFPGCSRPPVMCHAHHVRSWATGGDTALPNLVLLCGSHHRLVHGSPWEVRINADDHLPEFLPPADRQPDRHGHRAAEHPPDDPSTGGTVGTADGPGWTRHRGRPGQPRADLAPDPRPPAG